MRIDIVISMLNYLFINKSVVLHNLKNYDSHFIMQKLGKFNFKIHFIPNGLEKYMNFSINNKFLINMFLRFGKNFK